MFGFELGTKRNGSQFKSANTKKITYILAEVGSQESEIPFSSMQNVLALDKEVSMVSNFVRCIRSLLSIMSSVPLTLHVI